MATILLDWFSRIADHERSQTGFINSLARKSHEGPFQISTMLNYLFFFFSYVNTREAR
jgi:hypothetical protein